MSHYINEHPYNSETITTLSISNNDSLSSITFSSASFSFLESVRISNCSHLTQITIGMNCCQKAECSFSLLGLKRLSALTIGGGSFSKLRTFTLKGSLH